MFCQELHYEPERAQLPSLEHPCQTGHNDFAVLQHDQCGDAPDAVFLSGGSVVIYIDQGYGTLACHISSDLFHRR